MESQLKLQIDFLKTVKLLFKQMQIVSLLSTNNILWNVELCFPCICPTRLVDDARPLFRTRSKNEHVHEWRAQRRARLVNCEAP